MEKVARKARAKVRAPKAIGAKEATCQQTLGQIVDEEGKVSAKERLKARAKAKELSRAPQAKCPGRAMVASLEKNATSVEEQVTSQKIADHPNSKSESTKKRKDKEPRNCKKKTSQNTTRNQDLASCANSAKMQAFLGRLTKSAEIEATVYSSCA